MLWTPHNEFGFRATNHTTRPSTSAQGTAVTPGNNTKGSWTEILSDSVITEDCYWIDVCVTDVGVPTAAKDCLVDIGYDPTGGTSWAVLIPDLYASCAAPITGGQSGYWFGFPLFVKAGTALAARASVNNATVGTADVWVRLHGKPSRPELVRAGTAVDAFGIVSGSSRGTVITPGTTSEGAWTELTGATTTEDYWYWQGAYGVNDASAGGMNVALDIGIGDASTKELVVHDCTFAQANSEQISRARTCSPENWREVPAGARVYARAWISTAVDAEHSAAAYAVRG